MKKFSAILLSGLLIISAASCGKTEKESEADTGTKESSKASEADTSSEKEEPDTSEEKKEPEDTAKDGETTAPSQDSGDEFAYYVEISWDDYHGQLPEFYIYDTETGAPFSDVVIISSEMDEPKGVVTLGLPACNGGSYYLDIETYDVNTGTNNLFGDALAVVKDPDGNTLANFRLEDWLCLRGNTGAWYYKVCVFHDSMITKFDS